MAEFAHECHLDDEFDALAIEPKIESPPEKPQKLVEKYPAKLHAKRVAKFLKANEGIIYIPGMTEKEFPDSDQAFPFRQNRYFYYITGVNIPGFEATYDIKADRLTLWIPHADAKRILWLGYTPDIKECFRRYDVDDVRYLPELSRFFSTPPGTDQIMLYCLDSGLVPQSLPAPALVSPHMSPTHSLFLSGTLSPTGLFMPALPYVQPCAFKINASSLKAAIDAARLVKTPYEIKMIRKACEVSSIAHQSVAERLRAMDSERDVEAVFAAACTVRGARNQAYAIIAGAGRQAAMLHYGENSATLKGKQFLVLDAGCEWECYASDITRTLPINGRLTREGRLIHDLVTSMQKDVLDNFKPGAYFGDLNRIAQQTGIYGLLKMGILRGEFDEIRKAGVIRAFFPHGLGHPVGLECHDFPLIYYTATTGLARPREALPPAVMDDMIATVRRPAALETDDIDVMGTKHVGSGGYGDEDEDWFAKDAWMRLREGMVFAVEPGIYFSREYIEEQFLSNPNLAKYINKDVLEKFYPVGGVRIEDVLLLTEDGHEFLSTAPKGQALWDIINKRYK